MGKRLVLLLSGLERIRVVDGYKMKRVVAIFSVVMASLAIYFGQATWNSVLAERESFFASHNEERS